MERENGDNKNGFPNTGFTIIHKDFINNWTKIIGTGPSMLYILLLSYCYGNKKHAWPSVGTLGKRMGVTKNTVRKHREVLIKYGLIEKMYKRKSANGDYQTNIYQIAKSDKLPELNHVE